MRLFFAFVFLISFVSCSKESVNESLPPEQDFLKSFAENKVPGMWGFKYYDGWDGRYDKIEFRNDGIYDNITKSYYGTGEIVCMRDIWSSPPNIYFDLCKGDEFPDGTEFVAYPVRWRLQYKEASCIFMWVFDEIDFDAIPDHIIGFNLKEGISEYKTKWIVSDDGSSAYAVDVFELK